MIDRLRTAAVSLYPLLLAAFSGAVVIDIVYSRLMAGALALSQRDALFRTVSDLLLGVGLLVFLSGGLAILAAWHQKQACGLFIVSLFGLFALEFVLPIILMPLLRTADTSLLGPTIRLLVHVLATVFAFVGLFKYATSARLTA